MDRLPPQTLEGPSLVPSKSPPMLWLRRCSGIAEQLFAKTSLAQGPYTVTVSNSYESTFQAERSNQ